MGVIIRSGKIFLQRRPFRKTRTSLVTTNVPAAEGRTRRDGRAGLGVERELQEELGMLSEVFITPTLKPSDLARSDLRVRWPTLRLPFLPRRRERRTGRARRPAGHGLVSSKQSSRDGANASEPSRVADNRKAVCEEKGNAMIQNESSRSRLLQPHRKLGRRRARDRKCLE